MRLFLLTVLLCYPLLLVARTYPLPDTQTYPLDAMQYQGTITVEPDTENGKAIVFALVKLPNGDIHRLRLHDTLGKNYGSIINIEPERLYLAEVLPTCQETGGWKMRMNYLKLHDSPVNPRYPLRTGRCITQDDVAVKNQRITCDGQHCATTFSLHNHLLHRVRVRYEILASQERRLETGDIATDKIMNCYGLQTLQANEVMTRKAYIKTPDKLNSVLFMIAFVSSEEEALREPCLENP
jgi:hypothetical protein